MDGEAKSVIVKNNTGLVLACTALGLCAGAILGLLYAPKAGRETRALVGDKFKAVRDAVVRSTK